MTMLVECKWHSYFEKQLAISRRLANVDNQVSNNLCLKTLHKKRVYLRNNFYCRNNSNLGKLESILISINNGSRSSNMGDVKNYVE